MVQYSFTTYLLFCISLKLNFDFSLRRTCHSSFWFQCPAKVLKNACNRWCLFKLLTNSEFNSGSVRVDFLTWPLMILANDKRIPASPTTMPSSGVMSYSTKKSALQWSFSATLVRILQKFCKVTFDSKLIL